MSLDLFTICIGKIQRGLEDLTGFMIGGHNLNNIRCTDNTVSEGKLKELFKQVETMESITFRKKTIQCVGYISEDVKIKPV